MDIVIYPDPRLRRKNSPVTQFDATLADTVRAMFQTMYATQGVGLAAPQVGINQKLLVFNPSGKAEDAAQEVVLCNPKLIHKSKQSEEGQEGCLSFPEITGQVLRFVEVKVQAQDLSGQEFELELEGWEARIFQHELDHLDGILFIDRMTPASRSQAKPQLEELVQTYKESLAGS